MGGVSMEWKEVRLGDIADVQTGPFGSQLHKENYVNKGTPIVTVEHLGNKWFTSQNLPMVSDEDKLRLAKYCSQEGDVIFSRVGSVDRCSYVSKEYSGWLFSGRCLRVRPRSGINPEYLYYFLTNEGTKQYIRNIAVGATMPSINTKLLNEVPITIPSLEDQRRIASILSSLDRKIELNNKINADLEEMAQAIFKNWFVDFEPFKDGKFVDSELGMIPEGWKVSQIADIPHILETGKRPKGGAVEKGIPSVGAEHVKGMCAYDYSKTKYINCEFAAKLKTGKINGYELMIYKDGGKPGYFIPNFSIFGEGYPFENCYLNEHVFKLDFDGNKEFNIFCYFFFKTEQIMSYFNAQGAKAAIPGINKKDVENIYIFSPDNESVIKFGEFAYPLFKQMLKNAIENRTLSTLRDTLLPRLMSGELEVPE